MGLITLDADAQWFQNEVDAVLAGWQQGNKAAVAAVSPVLLNAVSIVGTPTEVVSRLDQWAADGVDEPLFSLPTGSVDAAGAQLSALKDALVL